MRSGWLSRLVTISEWSSPSTRRGWHWFTATVADRDRGLELLTEVRELTLEDRFYLSELPMVELYAAREQARHGDVDDAISDMRNALDLLFDRGQFAWGVVASAIFVETLLDRGGGRDLAEAEAVTDRMETAPLEMAPECHDLWLTEGACAAGRRPRRRERLPRLSGSLSRDAPPHLASRGIFSGPRPCDDGVRLGSRRRQNP